MPSDEPDGGCLFYNSTKAPHSRGFAFELSKFFADRFLETCHLAAINDDLNDTVAGRENIGQSLFDFR